MPKATVMRTAAVILAVIRRARATRAATTTNRRRVAVLADKRHCFVGAYGVEEESVQKEATRQEEIPARRPLTYKRDHAVDSTASGRILYPAAALSLAAALIHVWAMPEHFREWWAYGALFLLAALAQGLFGVAPRRRPRRPPRRE